MSAGLRAEIDRDSSRRRLLKYTRRAFMMLPRMDRPSILDVGCGSGVPTIELARLGGGRVVGVDTDQASLDELEEKIRAEGLSGRVEARRGSMLGLGFPDDSFDIIWVEGAVRAIGLEGGLREWRRLLRRGGFLVVHEEVRQVSGDLGKIPALGYRLVGSFMLPVDAHWVEYYEPLEGRVKALYEKHGGNPEALGELDRVRDEIEMVRGKPEEFQTAFYIIQKE